MDCKTEEIRTGRTVTMSENKVLDKLKDSVFKKKILYTLCFVALCVIDQIKGSADGRTQMIAVNCTGFVMAVIILSAYRLRDFVKIPYLVWTAIFLVGGVFAYMWGKENYPYQGRWITGILNVGIYGFLVIRLIYRFVVEKAFPKMNRGLFFVWCAMMLGMIISRNDSLWPLWFFVMFGCFYLTDYSKEELTALFEGLVNGLIIGFFLIQGAAFVFRPFDIIRYKGMYANPNINGLFYLLSYCAFLCKGYELKQKNAKIIWRLLTVVLAGSLYGFALLTQGKTTLLAMVVLTLIMLVFGALQSNKNRIKSFLGQGICLVLAAVLSFPLVFGCVRYLPALFHHPIWYEGEYDVAKVHSFDPIDSEKYVDWDEVLESSFGRILWFVDFSKDEESKAMDVVPAQAESETLQSETVIVSRGSGEYEEDPLLTDKKDYNNPIRIRTSIYEYYIKKLNYWGHTEGENGVWLTHRQFIPHAHNIFLQIAFNFGIHVCVMFVFLIGRILYLTFVAHKVTGCKEIKYLNVVVCGITIAFVLFGIFEIDWHVGQNIFTLFFVGLYWVLHQQGLAKRE